MTTKHAPATPLPPQQVAQVVKAGRGWLVTRNSATLADSDYEHVAREIADALNKRHAYPLLVEALRTLQTRLDACELGPVNGGREIADTLASESATSRALLRSLEEEV